MARYEAVRNDGTLISPIESPRPDLDSSEPSSDTAARYKALPSDEAETKLYSETTINPLSPATSTPISVSVNPRNWRQHLCDRIGYTGLLVLVLGTAVILVSSYILAFLWAGAESARNRRGQPELWNDIVFRDWSTRVVTICSATIRIALTFQIGFITAAISAVMLEASGSRFRDIATLSVQRASSTNGSPSNILSAAFRQCIASGFSGFYCLLLLLNVLVIALISTFTSTILLTDFGTGRVTAPNVTETVLLGINSSRSDPFKDFENGLSSCIQSKPLAHWRFAENKTGQAPTTAPGDTGDIYRAMLPFASPEARTSLEYYSGPGLINNHRTVCVGPKLDNITLNYTSNILTKETTFYLGGTVNARHAKLGKTQILSISEAWPVDISCPLQSLWDGNTDWPLSTCQLGGDTGYAYSEDARDHVSGQAYFFHPMMLINASVSLELFNRSDDQLYNFTTKTEGLWTRAFTSDGTEAVSVTVCFVNTRPLPMFNITMSGRPIVSEPIVDWRRLTGTKNNTGHLQQIGIDVPHVDNFTERGILDLQIDHGTKASDDVDRNGREPFRQHERLLKAALSQESPSGSWNLVTNFTGSDVSRWTARPEHSALIQEILKRTGDPAKAIYALAFQFSQMLYYAHQPYFDIRRPVTRTTTVEMLIPIQWNGLTIVLATLLVHLTVLVLTTVMFVFRTKASMLGNAWQAVSQVVSPQTREIVDAPDVDAMRDKDVEEWAKATGRDSLVYHLTRSKSRGRTEVHLR